MRSTNPHIPLEELADFAEGRAVAADLGAAMKHLLDCSACAEELHRLDEVISLMRSDRTQDAPRDLLAYAINVFRRRSLDEQPSLLRRIVAALSFDSMAQVPAFGVRSGVSASRQLIYSAEDSDIDLRITLSDDKWIVAGQVLREECVGGRVEINGDSGSATAKLNDLCEFTLPALAPGKYLLRIQMPDVEVEVPQLELKA